MTGISAHRPILKSMIGEKWRHRSAVKRAKSLCIVHKRKMHGERDFYGESVQNTRNRLYHASCCDKMDINCRLPAATAQVKGNRLMKVTAQWIAEQCGVSRGTVDRVVNGRPNVAPEVRERVQKMINEYGYKTPAQRQAARVGRGAYRIGVILPSWDAFFIRRMREGIRVAVHNRGLNDVNVLVEELKNRSHRSYFEAIERLEARGIDGLILTAPDTLAMSEEIDRLVTAGIQVVTCDSDVRQSRRLYHIGQDMVKSGRVAAGLLAPYISGAEVLVVTGNREFTAHGLRVRGFLDRLYEIFGGNVNAHVIESVEQYELTYDGVLQNLRQNPRLRGIYMANESVRGCMDALERAKPARKVHVVCHDLTPHARQYLEEGRLDFIIDQDFSAQTTRAIEVLAHTLRTGELPRQEIEYIHTSIITRELL